MWYSYSLTFSQNTQIPIHIISKDKIETKIKITRNSKNQQSLGMFSPTYDVYASTTIPTALGISRKRVYEEYKLWRMGRSTVEPCPPNN